MQKNMNISADLIALARGEGRHPVFDGASIIIGTQLYISETGKSVLGMEWQVSASYHLAGGGTDDNIISWAHLKSAKALAAFFRTGEFPAQETGLHGYTPAKARAIALREEAANAQPA